jgi:hypothetical protein
MSGKATFGKVAQNTRKRENNGNLAFWKRRPKTPTDKERNGNPTVRPQLHCPLSRPRSQLRYFAKARNKRGLNKRVESI